MNGDKIVVEVTFYSDYESRMFTSASRCKKYVDQQLYARYNSPHYSHSMDHYQLVDPQTGAYEQYIALFDKKKNINHPWDIVVFQNDDDFSMKITTVGQIKVIKKYTSEW